MLAISKGSSKALCFVIDTTKSMSDDIEAVRAVTSSIINSEVGTEDEPSVYILVPFNDPGTSLEKAINVVVVVRHHRGVVFLLSPTDRQMLGRR